MSCELSGETLALEMIHVVPFEMGSALFTALLDAVQRQADASWNNPILVSQTFPSV
jgi:hypothetical protein